MTTEKKRKDTESGRRGKEIIGERVRKRQIDTNIQTDRQR